MHEASLYEENSFVTLTYAPEFLPADHSLDRRHFQLFLKRLRKEVSPKLFRYYHCGEYGDKLSRPHYHALLFGLDFRDKQLWKVIRGTPLFTSEMLTRIWGQGHCSIGAVTFQSAAYVARYVMKKMNNQYAEHHYRYVDVDTGEIQEVEPEYTTMSLKPGIGEPWLRKFHTDVYADDFVVMQGKKYKTPRYYDRVFEDIEGEAALENLKCRRKKAAAKDRKNQTPERLAVREAVQVAKVKLLKRELA